MIHTVVTLLFLTSVFASESLEQSDDVQKYQDGNSTETDLHESKTKTELKQLFENNDKVPGKTDFKKAFDETNVGKSVREKIENILIKMRHKMELTDVPESELDRQTDKQSMLDKLITSIRLNNVFHIPANGRQGPLSMIRHVKPLDRDEKVGTGYTKRNGIPGKYKTKHELVQTENSRQDNFEDIDLSSNNYKGKTRNLYGGDLYDFKVTDMRSLQRPKRSIYQPDIDTPYERLDSIANFIRSQLPLPDRHRDRLLEYLSQKYGTLMDLSSYPSLQPDLLDMLNSSNKRRFNSWGGKRDGSYGKRAPLNVWDGERSDENKQDAKSSSELAQIREISKRAKEFWDENQYHAQERIKRPFHSWGGKRNGSFNHLLNANLAVNEGRNDNFEISVQSYNRKLPLFQQRDANGQEIGKRLGNDLFPWRGKLPFNDERISVSWADNAAKWD